MFDLIIKRLGKGRSAGVGHRLGEPAEYLVPLAYPFPDIGKNRRSLFIPVSQVLREFD